MSGLAYKDARAFSLPSSSPNRDTALVGAIVLEELDLVVDYATQSIHPRDPDRIVSEVE